MENNKIRITKQFAFEAAHALENYEGRCRFIHGHSYVLHVTLTGIPCDDENDPGNGMVTDFGIIKKIVDDNIINRFDHSLILRHDSVFRVDEIEKHGKIEITDFRPTCENMLTYFVTILKDKLPHGTELFAMRLHETATSYAEWFAEDQK